MKNRPAIIDCGAIFLSVLSNGKNDAEILSNR